MSALDFLVRNKILTKKKKPPQKKNHQIVLIKHTVLAVRRPLLRIFVALPTFINLLKLLSLPDKRQTLGSESVEIEPLS